ncbi:uncharacterized protein C15orf39 homolog isoform X3 [Phyllopteryx taeniolatus]|uniref:uncharacterized protein C15orf39 homolog isoform X3 n=1 Tax=Phyllopteryx taeniolatus TaxID=161469 RepID=UPI002AD3D75D|nr:uncharacterized protein C15orf39 homolog isoform X3 [Phyllopteryx taeniolatus]
MEAWEDLDIISSSSPAEGPKGKSCERNTTKTKSRVKSSSRRTFLDNSWSDDEDDDSGKHIEKESGKKAGSEAASPASLHETPSDNCWTLPLTSEDFPDSDVEPEKSSSFPAVCHPTDSPVFQLVSRNGSGMIIKLKREARNQAVSVSRVTFKWQRTGRLGQTLRPLSGAQKRKKRSLLKIKYCPYLSACHSTEHRRRWVLRSAVRRAAAALRLAYPDLVGKRIRHLYEEDDKSEVWYRGEVVRVHEAHRDPLKTVFEVRYDSEPEWKYYLELLIDYKKGWLIIEEDK